MLIFVQIAAYRDALLTSTIKDLIDKAKNPANLRIVVCNQFHPDDDFNACLDAYRTDDRINIIDIPFNESKGVCWARNLIQQYYNDEDYTLHLDSHMRFIRDWDIVLIEMIKLLREKGVPKPILTTYPPHFDPESFELKESPANRIILLGFNNDGILPMCWPDEIPCWKELKMPVPARFYAGGFSFTLGSFCKEVPHDPNLYFWGEEINMAIRAYTHGYDLFHPHINILWHYYSRTKSPRHWHDHRAIEAIQNRAFYRLRRLFDHTDKEASDNRGGYGLGNKRTLRDYEKYAGLLLYEQKAQDFTLKNITPPNLDIYITEKEWLNSFFSHVRDTLTIPCSILKEKDYDTVVISFTANGHIIHQLYLSNDEISSMINATLEYQISLNFSCKLLPDSWILSLHSISKGWQKNTRGNMPYYNKKLDGFHLSNCRML